MREYLGRGGGEEKGKESFKKHAMENQMWDREASLSYLLTSLFSPRASHSLCVYVLLTVKDHATGRRWGVWAFHWHSLSNTHSLNPSASFLCFSTVCKISFKSRKVRLVVGHCDTKPLDTERWSLCLALAH